MIGTGTVELRSAGKTEAPVLQRGDTVTLSPKDVFRLINNSSETFIVEVRSKSARYWTPESTYFETKKGRFVPGNQIYFEFVIPS
jgi:hypothetical protein